MAQYDEGNRRSSPLAWLLTAFIALVGNSGHPTAVRSLSLPETAPPLIILTDIGIPPLPAPELKPDGLNVCSKKVRWGSAHGDINLSLYTLFPEAKSIVSFS